EKPEALVGKRKREVAVARHGLQWKRPIRKTSLNKGFNSRGEVLQHGRIKKGREENFHAQCLAGPRDHLGGGKGMTAKIKEIVSRANAGFFQNPGPDSGEQFLD